MGSKTVVFVYLSYCWYSKLVAKFSEWVLTACDKKCRKELVGETKETHGGGMKRCRRQYLERCRQSNVW